MRANVFVCNAHRFTLKMGHLGVYSGGFWALAVLLWVSLISIQNGRLVCFGCPLEEYEALSELRSSLVRFNLTSPPTWARGERDCCLWERVRCNNNTRRVSQLMLSNLRQYNDTDQYWELRYNNPYWPLDLSIFSSFHELHLLNLSYNRINSSLSCIGLKKLEVLDLSSNQLQGSIPSCFGSLSSLTVLNLGDNNLNGTLGLQVLGLLGMKKLEVLDLSGNTITGGVPISLGNLSSLHVLNLVGNQLTGSLPIDVFDGLRRLQELRLQGNGLNGTLPPVLGRLASLQYLDLSYNLIGGNMASQVFANLTSLQHLDLSGNYFSGRFSFLDLANLSKLEVVFLSNNDELGVHLGGGGRFVPSFQLKSLRLSSCILDKKTAAAHIFLSSQYKLESLDLSNSGLRGNFPNRWFKNQTRLGYLNLRNNSLQGRFQLADSPKPSMQSLDLSFNSIGGSLPSNIGTVFSEMFALNFSSNHLIGVIPPSLGNMNSLWNLDLSVNNFYGEIPASLITNCTTLFSLKLSNNNLNGTLVNFNHHVSPNLRIVYLDGNKLTGTLPSNLSFGEILDVHDNQLSGEITSTIQSSRNWVILNLRGNRFEGRDLLFLCNQTGLEVLDLSNNKFSGRIPHCLPSFIEYISFARNSFTGSIPSAFFGSSFSNLQALDLSNNQLSGNLPSHIIGDDIPMAILILSGNAFQGPVPNQLCKLQSLQMLDLSHNLLSGSIPSCFGKMQLGLKGSFGFGDPITYTAATVVTDSVFGLTIWTTNTNLLTMDSMVYFIAAETEVEFVTKGNKQSYQSDHPVWMAGIDLSANRLTGGIPPELGNLSWIISLNLSYNCLTGPIPATFSNLTQIESLDLSHNKLSGKIPWQLTQLTSLEVFSVAHNNLSGCIPESKNQFSTFTESSYEGNTGLHGPPLEKTCTSNSSLKVPHEEEEESMHDDKDLDTVILYAVPAASFVVGFWVCIAVLYCNRKGRYIRMQLIDRFADYLYERISLILYKLKLANQNGIKARRR